MLVAFSHIADFHFYLVDNCFFIFDNSIVTPSEGRGHLNLILLIKKTKVMRLSFKALGTW